MFNSAKRPFYASTQSLPLVKRNAEEYQLLCNKVFSRKHNTVSQDVINAAILEIYAENKLAYLALSSSMSKYQWKLLTAIAREGEVDKRTSKNYITGNDLEFVAPVLSST